MRRRGKKTSDVGGWGSPVGNAWYQESAPKPVPEGHIHHFLLAEGTSGGHCIDCGAPFPPERFEWKAKPLARGEIVDPEYWRLRR